MRAFRLSIVDIVLLSSLLCHASGAEDVLKPGIGRRFEMQPGSALNVMVVDLIPDRSYEARVSHSAVRPAEFRVEVASSAHRRLLDVDKTTFVAGPEGSAFLKVTTRLHGVAPDADFAKRSIPFDLIVVQLRFGFVPSDVVALIAFLVVFVAIALILIVPAVHRAYFRHAAKPQHRH